MPRSFDSVFYGAAGGGEDLPSDDEFNRVSFLSHFDGANNGVNNVFDDGSTSNHTITANGNVTQGSFGPFARPDGEWAFNNTASTNDSFKVTAHDNFDMTNPFTIEGWIFLSDLTANKLLFGRENNYWMTHNYQAIGGASGKFGFNYQNSGNWAAINASAATVVNTWYFLQATYVGTTVTFYINGASQGTASVGSPSSNTDKPFYVLSGPGQKHTGTASNVRLSSVARSTSLPTAKFTSDSDTELLVCQSNRFVDNGPDGHTITTTAGTSVSAFGPILTSAVYDPAVNGASAFLDGTGDYLSVASSADFALGTGDFTVEFWVYQKQVKNYTIYFDYRSTNSQATLYLYQSSNGAFDLYIAGTSHAFTPPSMLNRWAHIAISRSSGTTKLFVDGVQYLSFSDSTNYVQGTTFQVGRISTAFSSTFSLNGIISNFRWVKGTAVYTSAFTPPTAPLTAITNTKLLLNMADGQAIDSTAQEYIHLIGNANTSTDQAKFGNTSLHLTGSGDKANISGDLVNFGTRDFTLEGFFRIADMEGTDTYFFDGRDGTSGVLIPNILFDESNSNHVRVYSYPYIITGATDISLNTWYHLALCRSGSSLKLFLNGTQEGSTYTTLQNYVAGSFASIGGFAGGTQQSMVGFIDDFRISKFARYTSNFTAPSAPFADKGQ